MKDEELRLECLKLAVDIHTPMRGMGERISGFNQNIPRYVAMEADRYLAYVRTGDIPKEI